MKQFKFFADFNIYVFDISVEHRDESGNSDKSVEATATNPKGTDGKSTMKNHTNDNKSVDQKKENGENEEKPTNGKLIIFKAQAQLNKI